MRKGTVDTAQKHPYTATSDDKSQITVLTFASDAGYAITPMVVYDQKRAEPRLDNRGRTEENVWAIRERKDEH